MKRILSTVLAAAFLPTFGPLANGAQDYWITHTFHGAPGDSVQALVASGSLLYGTTFKGGAADLGLLFCVNADGSSYRALKSFSGNAQGSYPNRALALDGSWLYGTMAGSGSYSMIYKVNTDGAGFTVLKSWNSMNEGAPSDGPVLGGSTLYGTLQSGAGAVYKINTDGSAYAVLKSFAGTGVTNPVGLTLSGGELYGVSWYGGSNDLGTIFKLGTNGTGFTLLKQFGGPSDGSTPSERLTVSGSTIYGVTPYGGQNGGGTLFRLNTDGSAFTVLKHFDYPDGVCPSSALVLDGSTLYGTTLTGGTSNSGTVFMIGIDGGNYTVIRSFTGGNTGYQPRALLLSASALYGTVGISAQAFAVFGLALPSLAPDVAVCSGNQFAAQGDTVSLSAYVSGAATLNYQWSFNGTNLIGSPPTNMLTFPVVQPSQSGVYWVVVTNAYGATTSPPMILTVIAAGSVPVTNLTQAGLRAAMQGPGPITFGADGLLMLDSTVAITRDTVLDGGGHHVVLDGRGENPLFYVETNFTLTLINLTVTGGWGTNGGGIWNHGGTLNLLDVVFKGNSARDLGGGIYNQAGHVNATNCSFIGNLTGASDLSLAGLGGGLESEGTNAVVNLDNCMFRGNVVGLGGRTPPASSRQGGAIFNNGTLTANSCTFMENSATGGLVTDNNWGNAGEKACGGAIANAGNLTLGRCLIASNSVTGGLGGVGADGIPFMLRGGTGGRGGDAYGAGLFNAGTARAINCTFAWNLSAGGPGGQGGFGGRRYVPPYGYMLGAGGDGGNGGTGAGDICSNVTLVNCTIAFDSSIGGTGGPIGVGNPWEYTPIPGTNGTGTGALNAPGSPLLNTLLAGSIPRNCDGFVNDLGHNLSSDLSCAFTNIGSMNNTDPLLAPLADNGGPILTMALLPGSPAIDAGNTAAAPSTDQRGYMRPAGAAADIGAFEFGAVPPVMLTMRRTGPTTLEVSGQWAFGTNQTCRLLASSDMVSWLPIATNQFGTNGTVVFGVTYAPGASPRFYRLNVP